MKLLLVNPSRIVEFENDVVKIGNSAHDPDLYKRISKACLNKRAFLFVSDDGFVVLKPQARNELLIWVAFSNKPTNRLSYFCELEQFARVIGVNHLVFWTNRKGFQRIATKYGFTPYQSRWNGHPITVWSKKLITEKNS